MHGHFTDPIASADLREILKEEFHLLSESERIGREISPVDPPSALEILHEPFPFGMFVDPTLEEHDVIRIQFLSEVVGQAGQFRRGECIHTLRNRSRFREC
jgi:hypothetical protein